MTTIMTLIMSLAFAQQNLKEVKIEQQPVTSKKVMQVTPGLMAGARLSPSSQMISLNLVDLTKGGLNLTLDSFLNESTSLMIGFRSFAQKEKVKKNNEENSITVERASMMLGATYWLRPQESLQNILITPFIGFGRKSDAIDTDVLTSPGVRAVGVIKVSPRLFIQVGAMGSSLIDNSFKGEISAGLGYML